MDKFAEIRPYNDSEVRAVIDNIIRDGECVSAIAKLKFSNTPLFLLAILKPVIRFFLKRQMSGVNTVADFQEKVKYYLSIMVDKTMTGFTVSGIDRLDKKSAYLFVSNHRDITLDPAFVNYALYQHGMDTVRIAIGDNLLTKDFATHLMRINKSFIVKRSETAPRKLLAALKLLSQYITHSISEDKHSVWIAQREGRAKNGIDKTDEAILKMFAIHAGLKSDYAETMKPLHIVPVSISYEYDPCDEMKANELNQLEKTGEYIKGEQEDIASIAKGISGYKGHVHLNFGEVISGGFSSPEELTKLLDKVIVENYVLHPSNFFAYEKIYGHFPKLPVGEQQQIFAIENFSSDKKIFDERMASIDETLREKVFQAYANAVVSKLELQKN